MNKAKKKHNQSNIIANNKKAFHDYTFEKQLEAGIVLEGWEVKSIRSNKLQLSDSYVIIKNNEIWLIGSLIKDFGLSTSSVVNVAKWLI